MADLILSPIADQILGGLGSAAVKEIASLWGVRGDLDRLEETISTIKAVLLDAEEKQVNSHQVRNWLHRLGGAVEEADILMDEFNTEALRLQVMDGNKMVKQVCAFFSPANQLAFRHKMGCRIWEINKKIDAISKDKNFHLEVREEDDQVILRRGRETHSFVRQEEVIGRDEDREKIVTLLLERGESEENVSVIPIVGMGGLGKTTLAQSAFNAETVQRHFEPKIWVCVSDNFDLKLIVQQIIKSATNGKSSGDIDSMDQVQKELQEVLNGKRYLLVLDDVWEEEKENWLKLKVLLLSGSHGSRIVVTTRSKVVAKITGSVQPYQLGILDDEKSWSLFGKMAFKQKEGERNLNIVDIGRQIVQQCGGVPLAIRVIGSMLSFKNSESEWLSFYKRFSGIAQQKKDDILPTLKLSYDRLTSYLKRCFAYCRLFPKDYRIEVQTLVKLWMAQGLLKLHDPSDDRCLEDVGYEYFVALLERSFFQEVKIDKFGTIETCKMHDLMHDLAIKVAGTEGTIVSLNSEGNIDKDTRHISFDYDIDSLKRISSLLIDASKIRTFHLLHEWPYRLEACEKSTLDAMISRLKSIHILGLNRSRIAILPKSIGGCKHLRYLDLSYNSEIELLPNSITSLLNLQTLRLNGCVSLQELPRDLKKLVNLRHLEIDWCYGLTHMPPGLSQLTKLQTLSKYVLIDESSSSIKRRGGDLKELKGLNKISGKLEILNLKHGNDAAREYGMANLKEKQYLRSLELKWIDDGIIDGIEASAGYEMALEALQPHPNIQELALESYRGVKISSWVSSLANLVKLTLINCEKCQHLVPLNQLHRLEKLELTSLPCLEYIDGEEDLLLSSEATTIVLPSLRQLRLDKLPNLKGWWREVVSGELLPCFPISLSRLRIEDCPQLSCMPLYPHLEEELLLKNTSLKPFQQTIERCYKGIGIPSSSSNNNNNSLLSPLSQLKCLRLDGIEEDLQCLPDWFKGLSCLKQLEIWKCSKLKDLSPGIQHLTSLEELEIRDCSELEEMKMVNSGSGSGTLVLRSLSLFRLPKLASLPESIQHLTNLQELEVGYCNSLETIPEGIDNLNSLKSLVLHDCPELKSLPEGIRSLTCLKSLEIGYCPILLKRCQREIGEDWPKIAHIQHLEFCPDLNYEDKGNDEETSFAKRKSHNIFKKFGLRNTGAGSGTSHV